MELGGNIHLENFDSINSGQLIVIKKIVGNYTKKISEKYEDFKKITVTLHPETKYKVKVSLETTETKEFESENKNLFFALDQALSRLLV